jgi:4-amino-4-deoxy-L-arabinose transferase-like glycosyltransferase
MIRISRNAVIGIGSVLLFTFAVVIRLYVLVSPHVPDYDEGVYWESLRLMHGGGTLYQQIYYSQPPLFLALTYPAYVAFGQTIFAARMSVALASLVGLCGAYILGKALAGQRGAFAALALTVASVPYLLMSGTLQAEALSVGFTFLAIGLALTALEHRSAGKSGWLLAMTGVCFGVALLSKLLAIATLVPIVVVLTIRAIEVWKRRENWKEALIPIAACGAGFLAAIFLTLAFYVRDISSLINEVVGYHVAAGAALRRAQAENLGQIFSVLVSPIGVAAALGTVVALFKHDWRVVPAVAWFTSTVGMLWLLVPLFPHHLVALVAPLVFLSALTLASTPRQSPAIRSAEFVALAALAASVITGGIHEFAYCKGAQNIPAPALERRAIADLQASTAAHDRIVTDAQFLVASAGRDTPNWLVDTSFVRIESRMLTLKELEDASSTADVRGVLFASRRLERVRGYHHWVSKHFRLVDNLGSGKQLWLR